MYLPNCLVSIIEHNGFVILDSNPGTFRFQKTAPCGYPFEIAVDADNISCLCSEILKCYFAFDPSYEAYLWLDNTGHGKNGAPYNMGDLYYEMVSCKSYIHELYEILFEYWSRFERAIKVWHSFSNVAVNPETETIESDWGGFCAGTNREKIWHWFEETFDVSINDLMFPAWKGDENA